MTFSLTHSSWESLIWAQLWQVTLLAVAVGVVCRLLCRSRPFLAHGLWLLVVIKCLTPPVFASHSGVFCWLPTPNLEVARDAETVQPTAFTYATSKNELGDAAVKEGFYVRYGEDSEFEQLSVHHDEVIGSSSMFAGTLDPSALVVMSPSEESQRSKWLTIGYMIWPLGVLASFVWIAMRTFRLLRRVDRRKITVPHEIELCFQDVRRRLRIRRRVQLVLTEEPISPVVFGLWTPRLMMAATLLADGDRARWESIFAHELIHVRRGDVWWCWITFVSRSIWWFHPLVHWSARRWSWEAERCCDEVVLAELRCSPSTYAHHLLDVFQWKQELKGLAPLPGIRKQDVTRNRLERIMKLRQGSRSRMQWWVWPVLLIVGAIVLPGGARTIAGQGASRASQDEQDRANVKREGKRGQVDVALSDISLNGWLGRAFRRDESGPYYLRDDVQFLPRAGRTTPQNENGEATPQPSPWPSQYSRRELANARNLQLKALRNHSRLNGNLKVADVTSQQTDGTGQGTKLETVTKRFDSSPAVAQVEKMENCSREEALNRVKEHLSGLLANRIGMVETLSEWHGDELQVTAVQEIVAEAEQAIQRVAKYGLQTFVIEISEYRGSKDVVSELGRGWSFVPSQLPESWSGVVGRGSSTLATGFDRAQVFADFGEFDRNAPQSVRLAGSSVQTVVSRTVPLRQRITSDKEVAEWMTGVSHSELELTSFPKVMIFNGQVATILSGSQRPFVTSLVPVKLDSGMEVMQPVISVLESGTSVHVRPIMTDGGHVHLDAKLVFSHIGDVEEYTFDRAILEDEEIGNVPQSGFTVQVPVFTSTKVSISTEIPIGGAYAVAGMESPDENDDRRIVVVIRVRRSADVDAIQHAAEVESRTEEGKPIR